MPGLAGQPQLTRGQEQGNGSSVAGIVARLDTQLGEVARRKCAAASKPLGESNGITHRYASNPPGRHASSHRRRVSRGRLCNRRDGGFGLEVNGGDGLPDVAALYCRWSR
jgi:hypothetical protein